MLPTNKWNQYGTDGLEPKGIVLHNTGNTDMSAEDLFNYLENECLTSQGTHFLVDSKGIVEVMPLTWHVWSTGKANDWAFNNCIAIEICDNLNNDLYQRGQDIAIQLVKDLMVDYSIPKDRIFFHNDFNKKDYCPHIILDRYGSRQRFILEELGG